MQIKTSITELYDENRLLKEIKTIVSNPNITGYTKKVYLRDIAIQIWTEHIPQKASKLRGCKYWTKNAYNQEFGNENNEKEKLTHEHVVPKKFLIEKVFLNDSMNEKDWDFFLRNFAIGCVVTKSDNENLNKVGKSTMPLDFLDITNGDFFKPWLRYIRAKIDVYEVYWNDKEPIYHKKIDLDSIKVRSYGTFQLKVK